MTYMNYLRRKQERSFFKVQLETAVLSAHLIICCVNFTKKYHTRSQILASVQLAIGGKSLLALC